jgi:hypothetical protein
MELKKGVSISLLKSCMIPAIINCNEWFKSVGHDFVITAGNDGKHITDSLHYSGAAIDVRTRELSEIQVQDLCDSLRNDLDNQFDIIIESDHIHIEYDEN